MVATSSLHFSPILHKPAIPHKSGLEPSPKVSCPTSLLPPTTITLPKSEHQPHLQPLATPLSLIPRQTMQQKSSFHHRQTKAKKAERSQIIVADTHCAKKDPPTTKKHWIKKYGLTWHHKKILDSGTKWLDGDLINASQKVLAKQFKHKFGGAGFQTIANGLCGNFSRNWWIYPNSTQWNRPLACNQNMWSEAPGSDCLRQSSLNSFRQRKSPNCKSSLHTRMCNSIKIRECCKPGWRVWLWSFHHSVSHHTLSRKIQLQSSTDEEPSEAMPRERTFHNVPHQRTLTHRKQHKYIAAAECQQWTQWSSATPAMNGFMWAPVSQWLLSRWTELQMELYYM